LESASPVWLFKTPKEEPANSQTRFELVWNANMTNERLSERHAVDFAFVMKYEEKRGEGGEKRKGQDRSVCRDQQKGEKFLVVAD